MTESRLQAENKELREQVREMAGHAAANVLLKEQIAALIKENHMLSDIVLNKQEKGQ